MRNWADKICRQDAPSRWTKMDKFNMDFIEFLDPSEGYVDNQPFKLGHKLYLFLKLFFWLHIKTLYKALSKSCLMDHSSEVLLAQWQIAS